MPTKKTELPVEEGMELGSQMSDTPIPQIETEIRQDVGPLPEETPVLPDESPNSQTDSESGPESENSEEDGAEESNLTLSPQTDSESEENALEKGPKARRTRRASTKKSESGTENETTAVPEDDGVEPAPSPRRRRSSVRPVFPVVAIDERLSVETDADKARDALLDLVESMKTRRILTGTIQGVERPSDNPSRSLAVLYHGDFKIMIPAEEAVEPPEDFRGRMPEDVLHYMLTKRLGAEVDYIIKGIDGKAGIAAASRLEAMAAKRKEYYFGTDRDGNNLLYEGICAEGRVVSVIRAGIFVDLFGVETYIPLRELSYQRMMDASSSFQPGQRILVKILGIDRSDRNHIRVSASIKQAGENPYEKALRRYSIGNRYVGTVSMVDTTGVFVALDGGIDCLCSYPKRGRPPRGARVTVRILGINHDSNRIWGAITHIATPR